VFFFFFTEIFCKTGLFLHSEMSALLETSVSSPASKARSRYFYQKRQSQRVQSLPVHFGLLIQKLIKLAPASQLGESSE